MKLKTLIFILLNLAISISSVLGQTSNSLKGRILDSILNQPLKYVTINIKLDSNSVTKIVLTDNNGDFLFEKLPLGQYTLVIASLGYNSKIIPISFTNKGEVIDLGIISINSQIFDLNEVIITANKPLIKQEVDRIIYDVQADPDSKALNMLDMLRKVPLITISAEDDIQLRGKSDYKILINGRPSNIITRNPQDVFRSMSASSIQRVEVITNPPAKYDSEGIAGIINIITNKKIVDGYSGSVGLMHNSLRSTIVNNLITMKNGKITFSSNIGKSWRDFPSSTYNNNRSIGINSVHSRVEQEGANLNKYGSYLYSFSDFSYEVDSLNLIVASVGLETSNGKQRKNQLLRSFDQNGSLDQSYRLNNIEYSGGKEIDLSINYQLGFKSNKEKLLTASYQYSNINYNLDNENIIFERLNYNDENFNQYNESGVKEQTIQLDYINQIKKVNVESGIKLILRHNSSDFIYEDFDSINNHFQQNENLSDKFDYLQNVLGFYNSYRLNYKKWALKLGVRLESTVINADFITVDTSLTKNYINLIPSISFQRKFENNSNLNFGYTQRIQRPGIRELNPFENKSNPFYYTSGNPNLVPVIAHNFELNYSIFKKSSFNIGMNYSFSKNSIQTVFSLENDGISRSSYDNIGKNYNLGTNFNVGYPVTKKLNAKLSGIVSYLWINGALNGQSHENKGVIASTNNTLNYSFGKNWRTSLSLGFLSNSVTFQSKTNGNFFSSANLSKDFFQKKATLFVSVTNPFQKFRDSRNQLYTINFVQSSNYINLNRGFSVNFNYRFGRLKEDVKQNKRGVNNDDLRNNSL